MILLAPPQGAGLHPKGTFQLHVGVQRGSEVLRARPGEKLREGDRLGFFYSSESPGHLTLLSSDESGQLVRLYPTSAEYSAEVAAGVEVRIPDGAVVGPARGCEWIFALFAPRPIREDAARESLRGMLAARQGCRLGPSGAQDLLVQTFEVSR